MGNTRSDKVDFVLVFVAAAIAATPSEEPYLEPATDELIQTGKASAHQMNTEAANDINPKKEGTGRFKKTANFPGAPYGLPGYKESRLGERHRLLQPAHLRLAVLRLRVQADGQ